VGEIIENLPMRLDENLTFKIYYGPMDEKIIRDLLQYNIVIVEPAHLSDEDLFTLQAAGVNVVGYLSLLEVGKWDADLLDKLTSEDILIEQTEEKGLVANPLSEHYRMIWTQALEVRIKHRGFDGVLLDTVDDILLLDKVQREEAIPATVEWIAMLKADSPELLIIQNRGFDVFLQGSARSVDGLLWENFDATRLDSDVQYAKLVMDVNAASKRFGARIMGLNRLNNAENLAFCFENKWLHAYVPWGTYSKYYFAEQTQLDWIYKGIIDPEWVLTRESWFVEEEALEASVIKKAKDLGIKMVLVLNIGAMDKSAVMEKHLEKAVLENENTIDSNTFILNNTADSYTQYFLSRILDAKQIGYEGILLAGTKNWYKVSAKGSPSRLEIYNGYTNFLRRIRQEFPEMSLYQYEGIMVVNPDAASLLDGFVWTEFADSLFSEDAWQQQQVEQLSMTVKDNEWEVYIFSGDRTDEIRAYCLEYEYVYVE
jgi:endo-alpha-1,4-polygalactosaminidase (GH114 family)